jgi:hypothetical protein
LQELGGACSEDILQATQRDSLANPERGQAVQGLGGIRKARSANPGRGKGKRGGFRYLYLYLAHRGHIHLLFLLDKDEQEDLTSMERSILRKMVARV